eukprot:TCONS_00027368-protein
MASNPAYGFRLCSVGKNIIKRSKPKNYPAKKVELGQTIVRVIAENSKILVLHYNALDAKDWTDFRYAMKQEQATIKVFPNKLTCKFLSDTRYRNMTPLFRTDTCLAYGNDFDLKKILKILNTNDKVQLIGGKFDDTLFNRQQVIDYSKLPTLEQARAELVSILQQPSQTLSGLLQTNQSQLSMLLQGYVDQQQEKGETDPPPQAE